MLYFTGMKLKKKSDKNLESLPIFPVVAWGLTIIFAFFVYDLATDLQETSERLKKQADALELKINTPVHEITDFSS